jgi:hypothetical protein
MSTSILFVAKTRYNAEEIFKTYVVFIYGNTHRTSNSFCKKNMIKTVTTQPRL